MAAALCYHEGSLTLNDQGGNARRITSSKVKSPNDIIAFWIKYHSKPVLHLWPLKLT